MIKILKNELIFILNKLKILQYIDLLKIIRRVDISVRKMISRIINDINVNSYSDRFNKLVIGPTPQKRFNSSKLECELEKIGDQ